jgi:hypothetical protein
LAANRRVWPRTRGLRNLPPHLSIFIHSMGHEIPFFNFPRQLPRPSVLCPLSSALCPSSCVGRGETGGWFQTATGTRRARARRAAFHLPQAATPGVSLSIKLSKNYSSIHIYGFRACDGKRIPPQKLRLIRKPFARNSLQNLEFSGIVCWRTRHKTPFRVRSV